MGGILNGWGQEADRPHLSYRGILGEKHFKLELRGSHMYRGIFVMHDQMISFTEKHDLKKYSS